MKLITVTNISHDGVTQGHRRIHGEAQRQAGVPGGDGSAGFERSGWGPPLLDDEASTFIRRTFQRSDAFLFGRRTYRPSPGPGERHGPREPRRRGLEHAAQVRRLDHAHRPALGDTTVLSGDVAAAVGDLRAEPGGELQVWGSGTLIRWLPDHRLVDGIVLLTYPVIVGQGTRLFPVTGPDTGLELADLRSTPRGLTIQTYRTTGHPQYESATS